MDTSASKIFKDLQRSSKIFKDLSTGSQVPESTGWRRMKERNRPFLEE
jgi:hypothetical protein